MSTWEYVTSKYAIRPFADPREVFTEDELAKLREMRARFGGHPECAELNLNERQLAFARWLIDHGRLSDGA
jgi:hypothetical protein